MQNIFYAKHPSRKPFDRTLLLSLKDDVFRLRRVTIPRWRHSRFAIDTSEWPRKNAKPLSLITPAVTYVLYKILFPFHLLHPKPSCRYLDMFHAIKKSQPDIHVYISTQRGMQRFAL